MTFLPPVFQAALLLTTGLAAFFDIRERRIPNWLVMIGIVLGFGLNGIAWGWGGLWSAGKGFLLGFGVYIVLHLLRAMGAGDVKLAAAVGSIAGAANWLGILFCTAILGGVLALIVVVSKGRVVHTIRNVAFIIGQLARGQAPYRARPELDVESGKGVSLPHAIAVFCGAAAFVGASWIWAPR